MKKNNLDNKKIVNIIVGISVLLLVGVGAYIVLKSPILNKGKIERAIANKEISLKTVDDFDKYFVYMTQEEAEAQLKLEKDAGKEVFLFPQVGFDISQGEIIIKQEEMNIEGKDTVFLTFNGVSEGTKVYTTGKGTAIGGVTQTFNWIKEVDDIDSVYTKSIYVGMSGAVSGIKDGMESDIYSGIAAGEVILTYVIGAKTMEVPVKAQIAYAIGDGGINNNFATFDRILQKNGRIVMIQR